MDRWTDNLVKMGWESDQMESNCMVADNDGARKESEEVITSSRI